MRERERFVWISLSSVGCIKFSLICYSDEWSLLVCCRQIELSATKWQKQQKLLLKWWQWMTRATSCPWFYYTRLSVFFLHSFVRFSSFIKWKEKFLVTSLATRWKKGHRNTTYAYYVYLFSYIRHPSHFPTPKPNQTMVPVAQNGFFIHTQNNNCTQTNIRRIFLRCTTQSHF